MRPRFRTLAASLPAAALLLLPAAAPAHADGYRYWSFWLRGADGWSYATEGPGTQRPDDGAVLGFRFAVSEEAGSAAEPRGAAAFAEVCAGTQPRAGHKRVALVIDPGTAADAPGGARPPGPREECARIPGDGTAADALAAAAPPLRYDANALLCAIAGYPASGCGERIGADGGGGPDTGSADGSGPDSGSGPGDGSASADGSASGDGSADDAGSPVLPLAGGVVAVLALAVAALWQARRRRS
ncbi:SCO2322 family protein [Streptomyces sp. TRM 70351]|uniref:SCO2322 family protein n=1 Tax=Streptomyces sp. TRM 70351 TaxID=3116552 RepID=UPI002E7AF382|nr:SCO2322 family protein [Streptomyces sp. TRM 70351]MEE1928555.1 SCO2322 family protein [Streptomyces sp. TRM 70351]